MFVDAHFHLPELVRITQSSADKSSSYTHGLVSVHSADELSTACEILRETAPGICISAGVHPLHCNDEFLPEIVAALTEGHIHAVGEYGFDFTGDISQQDRQTQELLFSVQTQLCEKHNLPAVLHVRKGIHSVFSHAADLARCPAVIFHSFSGVEEEMRAILRKRINAFFSFGSPLLSGNKKAARTCRAVPRKRLLLETDAPYQPPPGADISSAADLPAVYRRAAQIRSENEKKLAESVCATFCSLFEGCGDDNLGNINDTYGKQAVFETKKTEKN